ncbi:MAG: 3'(2'),5'-bisphosphate nucleotidase CysQ [Methyloceanibacter sp.]|nr:3'(2'),5'-bisphosphate nucleotidase CysQ [Methyloceanibacter sp.]
MTAITQNKTREKAHAPSHTREEDFDILGRAVREAGALASSYFKASPKAFKKADGSQVSEADLAVDAALKLDLTTRRKEYGWLSEESPDDRSRLKYSRVWMVDPIDGTGAFLREIPEWTVSAALVEDGVPAIGVVFNPETDELFHAIRGGGAFLNGEPIHTTDRSSLDGAKMIASGGLFRKKIWEDPWPNVKAEWVNSVAYRLALVAAGRGDATISLTPKAEWDLAAAAVIVEEAGGVITDHRGMPHTYNCDNPKFPSLVASGRALHPALIERTRRVDL